MAEQNTIPALLAGFTEEQAALVNDLFNSLLCRDDFDNLSAKGLARLVNVDMHRRAIVRWDRPKKKARA